MKKKGISYYPFGLQQKGYNNVVSANSNSTAERFTYNAKEFEESLGLNMFDLGARHMDPAIGRFMVIDPMADFINYQSPYVMADNNPVQNVDYYGLGIINGLEAIGRKVGGFFKRLFSGRNCDCSSTGQSIAQGFREPDNIFPRRKGKKRKVRKPAPSNRTEGVVDNTPTQTRDAVSPIVGIPSGIQLPQPGTPSAPIANIPVPNPPTPTFRGEPVRPDNPVRFNANIKFTSSSSTFRDEAHTEETLSKLIKTLKEYPQLRVLILGNFVNDKAGLTQQSKARLNGESGTVGGLQVSRADAIQQFLISRGIDWRRILIGNGDILPSGQQNMSASIIITNPKN